LFFSNKAIDSTLISTRAELFTWHFVCVGVGHTSNSASADREAEVTSELDVDELEPAADGVSAWLLESS